ncbi:MAG: putative DNA binding domain-containing protein [Clostridium sp.]|nr:putative DNA binding domain-containing protein [Clostridium sp.]
MKNIIEVFENLISFRDEYEWLDFKENWFSKDEIGEYISAIANGAALSGRECGYVVWGIRDSDKEVVGTSVNLDRDIDGEPYKHYLARNLRPSIPFETSDFEYKGKRIVMLIIPASKSVVTKYKGQAFIRIGSSKERLDKYPEWEIKLNSTLVNGFPTIVSCAAPHYAQNLSFKRLIMYYSAKDIHLNKDSFERSLRLRSDDGKYNVMAYILSDQNSIPIRVSIFSGKDKASPLFSVKEFGNDCIMYSMDKILEYGDAIDIIQADERNRISERRDVPLFDYEAFHEAILNAFIHNKWLTLNGPQISIFSDRMEILSHGGLALDQDEEGFYSGASIPVNEVLASIFLQLRLSERSGRGVPKIVSKYGRDSIKIEKNRVIVTIPFNKIDAIQDDESNIVQTTDEKKAINSLNSSQKSIVRYMRDNPNVTIRRLIKITHLSESGISKNIRILKELGIIERVGSDRKGYWKVKD